MTETKVVQAIEIHGFERMKRVRDDLNEQQKRLERTERYRIRYGRGAMRLEMYTPKQVRAEPRDL